MYLVISVHWKALDIATPVALSNPGTRIWAGAGKEEDGPGQRCVKKAQN